MGTLPGNTTKEVVNIHNWLYKYIVCVYTLILIIFFMSIDIQDE